LVSKNVSASGIGFEPVEVEIRRQSTSEFSYPRKEFARGGRFFDFESASSRNVDFHIIPFTKLERFHNSSRQSDGQAISPFRNLHKHLRY